MTEAEWEQRLMALVRSYATADIQLNRQIQSLKRELDLGWGISQGEASEKLSAIGARVHERQKRAGEELAGLVEMRGDYYVRVRNYGVGTGNCEGKPPPYHDDEDPCGQAPTDPHKFERLLYGEAIARGCRECDSCGYKARLRSEEVRARKRKEGPPDFGLDEWLEG